MQGVMPTIFHDVRKIPPQYQRMYRETRRPCGYCIECRLNKSRNLAMRCLHEASVHEQNCFLTLTLNDTHLPNDLSLDTDTMQRFWKRFRRRIEPTKIKYYSAGEYGDPDRGERKINPHYHACVFNYDFPDKKYYKTVNGNKYYKSALLDDLWGYGDCIIGDVTFESAAYVARYTIKKVYGETADAHYDGRLPEKSWSSQGLSAEWFEKYKSDVYPLDEVIIRGVPCKPPPYYDRLLLRDDPAAYADLLDKRAAQKIINSKNNLDLIRFHDKNGKPLTMSVSDYVLRDKLKTGQLDHER